MKIITSLFNRQIGPETCTRRVVRIANGNYRQLDDGFEFRWVEGTLQKYKRVRTLHELNVFEIENNIRIELMLYSVMC